MAKKLTSTYRPKRRGWIKVKNPDYWRYAQERELAKTFRSRSPFSVGAF